MENLLFSFSALVALVPASLQGLRRNPARDLAFWAVLVVAVAGPAAWVLANMAVTWNTGLGAALWVTIAATMALFAIIAAAHRHAWRLTVLLAPYMLLLGLLALIWQQVPGRTLDTGAEAGAWFAIHIAVSVVTYALVTIAAMAALAAVLQQRALKRKRPSGLSRALPSVADCEGLVRRLLIQGEVVLAAGLLTGMAIHHNETGSLIGFDHKTILVIAAFVVIGAMLAAYYISGVRGRAAAQMVLIAYLLLTLGYPGVKFVTDVLIG